jgi:hypothetical protein
MLNLRLKQVNFKCDNNYQSILPKFYLING